MAEIAVVIVNYNAAALTIQAVDSVLGRTHGGRRVHVHVVENASPDGDAAALQEAWDTQGWANRVTLHLEAENHGFGRGNNLVLRALAAEPDPPDKVLFLNPDAQLKNEAVAILADFLDAHPKAAIAGARIENPGGGPATAAFRFPGVISEFSDALSFGPVDRLFARWRVPHDPSLPTGPVGWVSGAAFMARRDVLADIGDFDPAFFLYYEEVDLMRAVTRAGWQIWHVAEAQVIHAEGAATGVSSAEARKRRPAYWYESWRIYFRKNHGRGRALAAALFKILGALMNHGLARMRGKAPAAPRHFVRDFWAMAVRPLVGLKAQPYD